MASELEKVVEEGCEPRAVLNVLLSAASCW